MRASIRLSLAVSIGLAAIFMAGSNLLAADKKESMTISGTVTLSSALADRIAPGDRLVLKLYHPDDGIEKDTRYWIIEEFDFPRGFEIAPSTDMNGLARWPTYHLEVFTDRDRDVLSLTSGELFAKSVDLIPLGTEGVVLELGERSD